MSASTPDPRRPRNRMRPGAGRPAVTAADAAAFAVLMRDGEVRLGELDGRPGSMTVTLSEATADSSGWALDPDAPEEPNGRRLTSRRNLRRYGSIRREQAEGRCDLPEPYHPRRLEDGHEIDDGPGGA